MNYDLRFWHNRQLKTAAMIVATVLGLIAMLFAGGAPFHAN